MSLHDLGIPCAATVGDPAPAWNDLKGMKSGTVEQTVTDDTQPGGPREHKIVYEAPFDRREREQGYDTAWAHFVHRLERGT